jgi:hypothetical protein
LIRDRATPKRVLLIDHGTPNPSKDAGSYATIQEMKLMQALGFKVTFVAQDLRHSGNLTRRLQRLGVECLHLSFSTSIK